MKLRECHIAAILVAATLVTSTAAHAESIQISIDKLVFSPPKVSAKVGDTIEWVNHDPLAHTATVKGGWDVLIPPGKTAGVVMTKAGSFQYFCRFHPNMTGRIDVGVP